MKYLLSIFALLLILFPYNTAIATPEEKGFIIAMEADKRNTGFGDITMEMLMVLKNKRGQENKRTLHRKILEVSNDGDKSLMVYYTPRDIKGTAFLNFSHKNKDDDQWLYLPALKRIKRISSRNKSGSFMGSEFAYEDFASQEIEKYNYKWVNDEEFDGQSCFIVEYHPKDKKNSGYSKKIIWMDKSEYRTLKIDYFDRKESHLKTLTIRGYQKYLNKYWRAEEMEMINHQNGKSTLILLTNFKFQTGLKDHDFNKNSLKRAR